MRDKGARPLSIAACTRKLDVDDRLALKLYYRAAGNLLKQASVYRGEGNIVELYVLLLRFSSLVSETVPQHRDYRNSFSSEKSLFRKKFSEVLEELESLKPDVQKLVDQINQDRTSAYKNGLSSTSVNPSHMPRNQPISNSIIYEGDSGIFLDATHWGHFPTTGYHKGNSSFLSAQSENQLHALSINSITPTTESLSRHSYFGPSLSSGREVCTLSAKVQYPTLINTSAVEILSLDQTFESPQIVSVVTTAVSNSVNDLGHGEEDIERSLSRDTDSTVSALTPPANNQFDLLNQLFPPPVAVPVQNVPIELESIPSDALSLSVTSDQQPGPIQPAEALQKSKEPKSMHISIKMLEEFLTIAKSNTKKSIETCGVLSGYFKKGVFHVSTLIVPKQEATSNTCEAINEEEIFLTQDKRGLFQLGWIHTHPSQSCFMSSVDLHTHYSYQVMLQEAIAIVMAPMDATRKYGIFRLSDPEGVQVIKQCQKRGFHSHEKPADGGAIYKQCDHVIMDPALGFEVIDLR